MKDTITAFYPRLAALSEIVQWVTASLPHDAAAILQEMKTGTDLGKHAEELEDLITNLVLDRAVVVTSYKGLGTSDTSSSGAMAYFEAHHPEAHLLLHAQAQELQKLLGKDGAAVALGQAREPFDINVLSWRGVYAVTAEEFEHAWFADEAEAVSFAQGSFEPFIRNAKNGTMPRTQK